MSSCKLLLAGLAAALCLGALVSVASANRLAMSENHFRTIWGLLTFEAGVGFFNVKCPATIEGSFHSKTLSKTAEQLIGYVTRVSVNNAGCTSGHATALTAFLPWHVRYTAFTGTLPDITTMRVRLVGTGFLVESAGFSCLYEGTTEASIDRNGGSGAIQGLDPIGSIGLKKQLPGFTCPNTGELQGTGETFVQGSPTIRITVTLVQ